MPACLPAGRQAGRQALGESGELEVLEELLAKSGHGRLLSADSFRKEGVSERVSADALRRPSKRESDYEKRKMLSERDQYGVRRRVRVCRAAASLNKAMKLTGFAGSLWPGVGRRRRSL